MYSEIISELRIMDFTCPPADITNCLGLVPTLTWVQGEPLSKTGRGSLTHQENGWALTSRLKSEASALDFRVLFDDLLKNVLPIKERFKRLPKNVCIQLSCCAYIGSYTPAFSLDEPLLRFLADINATVDFDLYCLPDDQKSD